MSTTKIRLAIAKVGNNRSLWYAKTIFGYMNEINKIGGNINQIVKNNNSHLYRESDKIDLIKYMEEINGLIKELVMTV